MTPWPWWALFYLFAVTIAVSRVGVRIHHASDVIGGAIVGTIMGLGGAFIMTGWVL